MVVIELTKYSNQRQIPIKNMKLNNTNSDDNISNDYNSSWLFNKSSGSNSADINPRMYVLKRIWVFLNYLQFIPSQYI